MVYCVFNLLMHHDGFVRRRIHSSWVQVMLCSQLNIKPWLLLGTPLKQSTLDFAVLTFLEMEMFIYPPGSVHFVGGQPLNCTVVGDPVTMAVWFNDTDGTELVGPSQSEVLLDLTDDMLGTHDLACGAYAGGSDDVLAIRQPLTITVIQSKGPQTAI